MTTEDTWQSYSRLVLAELERLSNAQRLIDTRAQEQTIQLRLMSAQLDTVNTQLTQANAQIASFKTGQLTEDAISKYRKWIVGLIFTVVTALVIPAIALILGAFGG